VEALLRCGADVNFPDGRGNTALTHAIARQTYGAHDNCVSGEHYNPRVRPGTTDIEEALLKAGADPNLEDEFGLTALLLVARSWTTNTTGTRFVQALLTAGAEVRTALHEAALNSCEEVAISIMETLVKAGADVDQQDSRGVTPLMHASLFGHLKTLQFFGRDSRRKCCYQRLGRQHRQRLGGERACTGIPARASAQLSPGGRGRLALHRPHRPA